MLKRFSISMDEELLARFDKFIRERRYVNRSEAVRDLIRRELVSDEWAQDKEVAGVVTMVYDHHTPGLAARLDKIQHRHHTEIVSTMHVHLDHENCLEIIAVRGQGRIVANMADCMLGLKGVRHGRLTCVATGSTMATDGDGGHAHGHEHGQW